MSDLQILGRDLIAAVLAALVLVAAHQLWVAADLPVLHDHPVGPAMAPGATIVEADLPGGNR